MMCERLMIDAKKVLERADEVTFMGFRAEERKRQFLELVSAILEQCSPVAAVAVVRCKDCKWSEDYRGQIICNSPRGIFCGVAEDSFCSYGERK